MKPAYYPIASCRRRSNDAVRFSPFLRSKTNDRSAQRTDAIPDRCPQPGRYAAALVYMAGLAHDAGAIGLRSVQGLPAVPGRKKVTADASAFIALTPEGMAGTSRDLPAA